MPEPNELIGASRHHSLAEGIKGADVVMALRIQRERMSEAHTLDADAFYREWGISAENLRHAAHDAIVMHPGPMNRGVEITSEVADGPHSVIRQQVTNGVAVRMAVLSTIVRNVQERNVEAGRRAG
jgi:aspartate carbamoyltransferase catalytic subunit